MLSRTPPANRSAVYVTRQDYDRLIDRADALSHTAVGQSLLAELDRATITPDRSTRAFVKLGSTVAYEDVTNGVVRRLKLCLPEEASLDDQRLSVLTPVGAILIGATVGQVLEYVTGDGRTRQLRVLEVGDDA